jgi:O-antigen/teichoic acid export membrane protein
MCNEMENASVNSEISQIEGDEKNNILKRISIFTTSNVISNFVSMVTNVAIARIMGPAIFGEWQTFRLLLQYSTYSSIGVNTVMSRRLPQLMKDGECVEGFYTVRNSAYCFNLFSAITASLIIFIIMLFRTKFSYLLIFSITLILFVQLLYNFRFATIMAQKNLESAARLVSTFSLAGLVFILPLSYFYKLQGAILGQLTVFLLVLFLVHRFDTFLFSFKFDFRTLGSLLREGSLFCLHGLVINFGLGHERLLLLYLHGTAALGTYGLAILTIGIFEGIASHFFIGLFPFLSEKARPGSLDRAESMAMEGLEYFSLVILALGIIAATLLGPVTRAFLPKYEAGMWGTFWVIGALLFCPIRFLTVYYRASRDEIYLPILVYVVVLAVILWPNYIIIRDYGVLGAAVAQTVAQIGITIFLTLTWRERKDAIRILLRSAAIFPIILLIGWFSIHYYLLAIPLGFLILALFLISSGHNFMKIVYILFKR